MASLSNTTLTRTKSTVLSLVAILLQTPVYSIDLNSSFVQNGGNSSTAISFIHACRLQGIVLELGWILSGCALADLFDKCAQVTIVKRPPQEQCHQSNNPRRLLSEFSGERRLSLELKQISNATLSYEGSSQNNALLSSEESRAVTFPVTEMQLAFIHGHEMDRNLNVISYCEIYRPADIKHMKTAWRTVLNSEPIFRTHFVMSEGKGRMIELAEPHFSWSENFVSNEAEFKKSLARRSADVGIGQSFSITTLLGRTPDQSKSAIVWNVHHALIDGYSSALVLKKVQLAAAGISPSPGPSFAKFAAGLDEMHERYHASGQLFWQNEKTRYPSAANDLLLSAPNPQLHSTEPTTQTVVVGPTLVDLSDDIRKANITSATLVYAAWALVLSMYMGSDVVVFGVVLSGRDLPLDGIESVVGPVINILPLRVSVEKTSTTTDYLHHLQFRMIELRKYQWTRASDGFQRNFSTAVSVEYQAPLADGRSFQLLKKPSTKIHSEVSLYVLIDADGLIRLNHRSQFYDSGHVESLGTAFRNILCTLGRSQHSRPLTLENILHPYVQLPVRKFGNPSSSTTGACVSEDLVTLFQNTASQFPNSVAIEKDATRLVYSELRNLVNIIASQLSLMVAPGEIVCVQADRSVNWIIAIYAILNVGAVFCPLDDMLPARLRDSNFKAAGSKLYLASSHSGIMLKPESCQTCLSIEEMLRCPATGSCDPAESRATEPANRRNAYLCFTSGSTGQPKGVLCRHESLIAFQSDPDVRLFAHPGRRISQIMSPAFDGSIHEVFSALSYGATLVLAEPSNPLASLAKVDSAVLTPSMAKLLNPNDFPELKALYLVGEAVPQKTANRWASHTILFNMYGPTEITCGATIKRLFPNQPVTIGSPNRSTRVYILDDRRNPVPISVIGEICVAGVQVSEGYIGMQEETANKFIEDSICKEFPGYMYRTGDFGYWTKDGEIVCVGRKDREIKIRGFRTNLDDLETRMHREAPEIDALCVVYQQGSLHVMVQPGSVDTNAFRKKVSEVLPPHALPGHIVPTARIPLTRAGKVDYEAVAKSISTQARNDMLYNQPINPANPTTVAAVVSMCRNVLEVTTDVSISEHSSFLDLGGNSIQQMLLLSRLKARFGKSITLRDILETPTLGDLVKRIEKLAPLSDCAGLAPEVLSHELSAIEMDWWKKYEAKLGTSAFNVSFVAQIQKSVDLLRLTAAFSTVLSRHRLLSCKYTVVRRKGVRRQISDFPPQVEQVRTVDIWQEVNRPFDLQHDFPVSVSISPSHLAVRISHIVCDFTSLRILLGEVATVYNGQALPNVLNDYTLSTLSEKKAPRHKLEFWSNYLGRLPNGKSLASKSQDRDTYGGTSVVHTLPTALLRNVVDLAARDRFTLHQAALAAVALTLQADNDALDIILGAPFINRSSEREMHTVGLFLEPLPIRITYPNAHDKNNFINEDALPSVPRASTPIEPATIPSLLQTVRQSSQSALANAVPWTELLDHFSLAPDYPNNPLFDTMVTFHDERHATPLLPIAGINSLYTWSEGAKFKLMFEFLALEGDTWTLRVEYDDRIFERKEVNQLVHNVERALGGLVEGHSYDDLKEMIKSGKSRWQE